jgi:hypothetical protein
MQSSRVFLLSLVFIVSVGSAEPAPTGSPTAETPAEAPAEKSAQTPTETPAAAASPQPAQPKFKVAGASSKFIRLQPFEALPPNLQFGPQDLLIDEAGAPHLVVAMGNVTESVKFDGRDFPCDKTCTLTVPLQRRNHVLLFEYGTSRARMLVAWVALPLPTDKLPRLTYNRASGLKTVQDNSGYDPAVFSLVLVGKGGLAETIPTDQVPSLHVRTFSYAAAEASEWRLVVLKDKTVVTTEGQRGAVPEQIEIGSKLGADLYGEYTIRIDMAYAGKFFQGQDSKLFIGNLDPGSLVADFELSGMYLTPDRLGYSIGPFIGYSLGFKINDESRLRVGAAFTLIKIAVPKSIRPLFRVTTGYERRFAPGWDAEAGVGVSTGIESGFAFVAQGQTSLVLWDSLWGMTAVAPIVGLTHYFGEPSALELRVGVRARF